jgi:hypothetical protein
MKSSKLLDQSDSVLNVGYAIPKQFLLQIINIVQNSLIVIRIESYICKYWRIISIVNINEDKHLSYFPKIFKCFK